MSALRKSTNNYSEYLGSTTGLGEGNIAAGGGYSTDTQQAAPQLCYNATISSTSGQSSSVKLSTAQSFSDIQNNIHESITVKGGFGMFSASAGASYLRSIEDKYYSMSLNYHAIYHNTANIQLAGNGLDALTESGKTFYVNGTNPYFGIMCGDEYFSWYKQGAMLLMGINIEFKSHSQKEEFNAHAGASFGDISSASGDIQKVANQFGISGSVSIIATQIGGDPSQISKILSKNSNGDYYVLTCSLNAMGNCISAASGMLDYAVNIFPTQISFPENKGLTPLGTGFAESLPIYYAGLTPPPSFVTQQVINDRLALADSLEENQYYQQRFENLLNGYPIAWDTTSNLYKSMEDLRHTIQDNLDLLMSSSNPKAGGLGCYITPDKCVDITETIQANLVPITADDLSVLKPIQYILPVQFVDFYFSGTNYGFISNTPPNAGAVFNNMYTFTLTDSAYSSIIHFCGFGNNCDIHKETACYSATSTDGMNYSGTAYTFKNNGVGVWTDHCTAATGSFIYSRITSPFWFEAYNNNDPEPIMSGESFDDTVIV